MPRGSSIRVVHTVYRSRRLRHYARGRRVVDAPAGPRDADNETVWGNVVMSEEEIKKPFDVFELAAALLLGVGAVATAVAGHQSGLWGGASVEGYGESSAMTTEASATFSDELTSYIQDAQVDVRAKEMVWEASEIDDEARATRLRDMASWLYTSQLSEHAYKELQLPDPEVDPETGEAGWQLPAEALDTALNIDLGEEYVNALFEPSSKEFDAAKARFAKAREANEIGDKFSLAGVILTISLFFGGLALVFKSSVRWGFLGAGGVVLIGGLGYMMTLTWA